MKQVSKTEFYDTVGNTNSSVSVDPFIPYPYTTNFKLKSTHKLIGKVVKDYTAGVKNRYPIISTYYSAL